MDDQQATPPSAKPKRFFDVKPSGQAAPSSTSRPLIIGKQPPQADPMFTDKPSQPKSSKPPAKVPEDSAPDSDIPIKLSDEAPASPPEPVAEEPEPAAPSEPTEPISAPAKPSLPEQAKQVSEAMAREAKVVIHQPAKKTFSARHILQVVVILIFLAIVITDILLDTGAVKTSLNIPHTKFFSQH